MKTVICSILRRNMTPKSPFILKNYHGGSHPATLTFQKHVALTQLSVTLVPTRRQQNLGCCPKIQPACNVGMCGALCSIWLPAAEGYAAHESTGSLPGRKCRIEAELTFFYSYYFIFKFPFIHRLPDTPLLLRRRRRVWVWRWERRSPCCSPSPAAAAAWVAPLFPRATPGSITEPRPRWATPGFSPGGRCAPTGRWTTFALFTCRVTALREPASAVALLSGQTGAVCWFNKRSVVKMLLF